LDSALAGRVGGLPAANDLILYSLKAGTTQAVLLGAIVCEP